MGSEVEIRRPVPPVRTAAVITSPARSGVGLVLQVILRLIVAGVFVYAAQGKIRNPANFAKEIQKYNMAPDEVTNLMAAALPWMEVIAPVLLLAGFLRGESRFWLLLMLVVFTAVKSFALLKGLNIHCGCVPAGDPLAFLYEGWKGVLTNVALILAVLVDGAIDRRAGRGPASLPPAQVMARPIGSQL